MTARQDIRCRVAIPADYRVDGGSRFETSVIDISEFGCCLRKGVEPLEPGAGLSIAIANMGPVSARVRWRYGAFCGISFTRKLETTLVDHLYQVHARGALTEH